MIIIVASCMIVASVVLATLHFQLREDSKISYGAAFVWTLSAVLWTICLIVNIFKLW